MGRRGDVRDVLVLDGHESPPFPQNARMDGSVLLGLVRWAGIGCTAALGAQDA